MMLRGRWPRSTRASGASRSGRRSVEPIVTMRPRSSAARITPDAIVEKYGSEMSATTRAIVDVPPLATAWAARLGV